MYFFCFVLVFFKVHLSHLHVGNWEQFISNAIIKNENMPHWLLFILFSPLINCYLFLMSHTGLKSNFQLYLHFKSNMLIYVTTVIEEVFGKKIVVYFAVIIFFLTVLYILCFHFKPFALSPFCLLPYLSYFIPYDFIFHFKVIKFHRFFVPPLPFSPLLNTSSWKWCNIYARVVST